PTPVYLSLALPADTETGEVQEAAARAAEQVIDPLPDVRGGAEFKRRLGLVAVRDAAGSAWEMTREEEADDRRNTRRRWWRGR
ncbi:MAG: molybdopterin dehydrogenase, partial [Pseudonocardia sp.]|nr:molybdopterin dehydrogenase [Pseudonocardia sp.]